MHRVLGLAGVYWEKPSCQLPLRRYELTEQTSGGHTVVEVVDTVAPLTRAPWVRFPQLPSHRGDRIRTGVLGDPNAARYQAAPRPVP